MILADYSHSRKRRRKRRVQTRVEIEKQEGYRKLGVRKKGDNYDPYLMGKKIQEIPLSNVFSRIESKKVRELFDLRLNCYFIILKMLSKGSYFSEFSICLLKEASRHF